MALTLSPQNPPALTPDSPLTRVLAFVGCGLAGFVLMGVLSLHIWPSVLPYSQFLVTQGAGLAVAVFIAVVCGIAGLIACVARCDSDADWD